MADKTAGKQKRVVGKPFKPGQSGNPKGRPKGARSKLGEQFLNALRDDFQESGIAAIKQVRTERPSDYVKVIASLLPKEMDLGVRGEITAFFAAIDGLGRGLPSRKD